MYLLPRVAVWLFAVTMLLPVSVRGQGSLDPGVDVENRANSAILGTRHQSQWHGGLG